LLVGIPLMHVYLWMRLVRNTTQPGRIRLRMTILLAVLALLLVVTLLVPFPPVALVPVQWAGFIWLGPSMYSGRRFQRVSTW
jgi:uncharacterized protein